ncbi:MAG: MATE family efflux transporter [Candidatus Aminicenantes bacterium]|nr:MATE family efflux transporter [Candidatus Aminicenantes bacterium]
MSRDHRVEMLQGGMVRAILGLGVPLALASVVQTLYNLADAFWLGKLGSSALAAPVISFNIIFFIISLGMGFSVAGTSLVSQYMGSGDSEKARKAAGNLFSYMVGFSVFFVAVGLIWARDFLVLLHTPADALQQTLDYYRIMVIGMPAAFPFFVYRAVMNGYGDTRSPLRIELISAAMNVILDPILIFGWLGMPAMGVSGAALATVLSRAVASGMGMWRFFTPNQGFFLCFRHLLPGRGLFSLMVRIGIPSSIGMSGASLGFLVLMGIVNRFGTEVVSAYGITIRVVHLFMMPAMGVSQAVTAIVGQNLGAGNVARARLAVNRGMRMVLGVLLPAMLVTAFSGRWIIAVFISAEPEVMALGQPIFRLVAPSVIFFAVVVMLNGVFQGAGHTLPVMFTNLSRIWIFRVPLVYFLAMVWLGGPGQPGAALGIWWGMLVSNALTAALMGILYLRGSWAVPRIHSA